MVLPEVRILSTSVLLRIGKIKVERGAAGKFFLLHPPPPDEEQRIESSLFI
jgi:hypothetical protein